LAISNDEIKNLISSFAKKNQLKPVYKNDYTVNAQAQFDISIIMDEKTFSVKKNNTETKILNNPSNLYQTDISKLISSGPIGKYTISIQKREINNYDFSNNKITKYKGTGGPSNLFLSLIIPGLGDSPVTGGSKTGLSRTIVTYACIGVGICCKLYSNSEYDKYHNATVQSSMNTYYQNANTFNRAFYFVTAAGAIVWIYDIIWVAKKGIENQKKQQQFKNNLSFNYEPNYKTICLTYNFKF